MGSRGSRSGRNVSCIQPRYFPSGFLGLKVVAKNGALLFKENGPWITFWPLGKEVGRPTGLFSASARVRIGKVFPNRAKFPALKKSLGAAARPQFYPGFFPFKLPNFIPGSAARRWSKCRDLLLHDRGARAIPGDPGHAARKGNGRAFAQNLDERSLPCVQKGQTLDCSETPEGSDRGASRVSVSVIE